MSDPKYKLRMKKTNRGNSLRAGEGQLSSSTSAVRVVQDQQVKRVSQVVSAVPNTDSIGRSLSYSQQQLIRLPTTRDGKVMDQIAEASGTESSLKTETITMDESKAGAGPSGTISPPSPQKKSMDSDNFEILLKDGIMKLPIQPQPTEVMAQTPPNQDFKPTIPANSKDLNMIEIIQNLSQNQIQMMNRMALQLNQKVALREEQLKLQEQKINE